LSLNGNPSAGDSILRFWSLIFCVGTMMAKTAGLKNPAPRAANVATGEVVATRENIRLDPF